MKRFRPLLVLRTTNRQRSSDWESLSIDIEQFLCRPSDDEFVTEITFRDRPFRRNQFRLPAVWRTRLISNFNRLQQSDHLKSATLTFWIYHDTYTASVKIDSDHLRFFHECGLNLEWVFLPTEF